MTSQSPDKGDLGTIIPTVAFTRVYPSQYAPFERHMPVDEVVPFLEAVQLNEFTVSELLWFMLRYGREAVSTPADRSYIQWGKTRFDTGEWIVLEWMAGERWARLRHATEAETQKFGLS